MSGKVADYKPGTRMCLGCGKHFPSQGPGNRFCGRCRSAKGSAKAGLSRRKLEPIHDARSSRR